MPAFEGRWSIGHWLAFLVLCGLVGLALAVSFTENPESWWFVPAMLKP
jgi:hypothetical protein